MRFPPWWGNGYFLEPHNIHFVVQFLFPFVLYSLSYITVRKKKGNKNGTKDKIEPQQMYVVLPLHELKALKSSLNFKCFADLLHI